MLRDIFMVWIGWNACALWFYVNRKRWLPNWARRLMLMRPTPIV
jgi:hypothetical protein